MVRNITKQVSAGSVREAQISKLAKFGKFYGNRRRRSEVWLALQGQTSSEGDKHYRE